LILLSDSDSRAVHFVHLPIIRDRPPMFVDPFLLSLDLNRPVIFQFSLTFSHLVPICEASSFPKLGQVPPSRQDKQNSILSVRSLLLCRDARVPLPTGRLVLHSLPFPSLSTFSYAPHSSCSLVFARHLFSRRESVPPHASSWVLIGFFLAFL